MFKNKYVHIRSLLQKMHNANNWFKILQSSFSRENFQKNTKYENHNENSGVKVEKWKCLFLKYICSAYCVCGAGVPCRWRIAREPKHRASIIIQHNSVGAVQIIENYYFLIFIKY